jgi:hypothetical protein
VIAQRGERGDSRRASPCDAGNNAQIAALALVLMRMPGQVMLRVLRKFVGRNDPTRGLCTPHGPGPRKERKGEQDQYGSREHPVTHGAMNTGASGRRQGAQLIGSPAFH